MLLIVHEVMSGFGRTGEWFGIYHYPDVKRDILVFAKGVTCGYVPLFFFNGYGDHRDLHSFPTRRSSDLLARSVLDVVADDGAAAAHALQRRQRIALERAGHQERAGRPQRIARVR